MPLIAAGIGAAGSIFSGIMGGKGAKKAAKVAAKSQEKISAANNALVREMYGQNAARLDPYIQGGTRANNVLMELLLGPAPAATAVGGAGMGTGGTWSGGPSAADQLDFLLNRSGNTIGPQRTAAINAMSGTPEEKLRYAVSVLNKKERPYYNDYMAANPQTYTANPAPAAGATDATGQPTSALSAWDQFRQGSMYDWRFKQGQEATAQNFAGTALDSGAQRIAEIEYGQGFGSNELSNWMNMLAGQQGVGLQAGGALAGVGMNATNAQMQNNQNAADANSNRALIAGQANQNMWGTIGQGIGKVAGAFGSSYANPAPGTGSNQIVTNYNNPAWGGGSAWG